MAYTDYSSLFQGAEQKYGLPPGTLSGVGYVESRYNPQAVSPAGAQGMMQFMPTTAKNMGLTNPFDPAASIYAAGNLLSQNMKAQGGNLRNALMMYNAGTNPNKWQPSYADQVLAHASPYTSPPQAPQMPQDGGPLPMPPPAPATLGALAKNPNLNAQVDPSLYGSAGAPMNPASLGALANGPAKQPSKFTAGNVLGVLGDALSAYGGRQPTFGPFLQQEKVLQQQQDFEREKFQQELAMRMYAMTHPQDMMDGIAFANAPKPVQEAMVYRENALHPVVADVQRPDGSFIRQTVTRQLPPQVGEIQEGHRYLGGDPANPNSWQAVQ